MEIKLKGDKRSFIVLWIEGTLKEEMTVTDVEGNVYKTVNIGTQVWMAENMKTITYNDGAGIPLVTDNTAWSNLTTPGYCWLFNDEASYKNLYGALYNWQAINTGKLCPVGWHMPSITEWITLEDYLGGFYVSGGKMKETGTTHWLSPNIDATNASGFTGLPGGHRGIDGVFLSVGPYLNFLGECGYFLSSSEVVEIVYDDGTHPVSIVGLHNENGFLGSAGNPNKVGMSVRCIKDSN
jgi:uncharacterized protein (TIGR02145 family)